MRSDVLEHFEESKVIEDMEEKQQVMILGLIDEVQKDS